MEALHLLVGEQTLNVGESGRVSHVDGDGVAVTERNARGELVERGPAVREVLVMILNQSGRILTCGRMQ